MESSSRTQREEVFKEAVAKVLSQWTLLNLAVELGWGERGGTGRRQQLFEWILETFAATKRVKADWLAEKLSGMLENFFNAVAEDDSDIEVAQLLVALHDSIVLRGDFSMMQQLQQEQRAPLSACREMTSDGLSRPAPAAATAAETSSSSEGEHLSDAEDLANMLQVTHAVGGAPDAAGDLRHTASTSSRVNSSSSKNSHSSASGSLAHFHGVDGVLPLAPAAATAAEHQQQQEHEWATVRRGRRRPC